LQESLLALIRAIANLDIEKASALLDQNRSLASAALATGATRTNAQSFYFKRIAHYAYAGDTALHIASAAYLPGMVTQLLACGANVSAANRRGAQPIHYASDGGPTAGRSNEQDQADVIRALILAGADANALDKSGVAPIHRAVRCRCSAAVEALLDNGANPRLRNGSGSTPLHLAVLDTGRGGSGLPESRDAQIRIVQMLLAHGASRDDRDSRGRTVSEICDPLL
jgi:ankyrin repeat protein